MLRQTKMRLEKDFLGELEVPEDVYWGIHTARAVKNFPIGSVFVPIELIRAYALVKKSAALANWELGYLEESKAKAILQACDELTDGCFDDQFRISVYQGGAGTSTNMAVNEVIANRAIEILGGKRGDYRIIHPIDDVNLHQSTNDTYPTALRVASIFALRSLSERIATLQGILQKKEAEFADVVKIGRTELQEAVPITLGAEFGSFAEAISRDRWRTFKCEERLRVINLGGTAVGTGITAPRDYIFLVVEKLRDLTGLPLSRAEHIMGDTGFLDSFVETSGIIVAHASNLMKIATDLRMMNLLGEIKLPKRQAGSSIMPGKVNPVICEAVIQVALRVVANNYVIGQVNGMGSFQINEFLPLLAYCYLESLKLLIDVNSVFADYISEITADRQACLRYFDMSPSLVTAFLPELGYERCSELAKDYESNYKGKITVREFLKQKLGEELVSCVLSPYNLTRLGYRKKK